MTIPDFSPNYVTDASGQRVSVLLTIAEWEQILELLEDLEDILLIDEVKSRNEETVPLSEVKAYLKTLQHESHAAEV